MATPLQDVYDTFLARISSDDWMQTASLELLQEDWYQLLQMAVYRVKFPRVSLAINYETQTFDSDLNNQEIQLLGALMKHEWVKRCVATWENLKQFYSFRDYSPANYLHRLVEAEEQIRKECVNLCGIYYRSISGAPSGFAGLAGKEGA